MKKGLRLTLSALIITLALSLVFSICHADYDQSYQLIDHVEGSTHYRLNVIVSDSLHDYYVGMSHRQNSNYDFAKFITPYAVKPIADRLHEIYSNDEDFANSVLMIVHQISYEVTGPPKYPIEVIAENKGDCDLFSFTAASILKAGGIDVVLLLYETESHMNIGIRLASEPVDSRQTPNYLTYAGSRYYIAECTGGNWQGGWRIGEQPENLADDSPHIISLEGFEQVAPAQVSASYSTLLTSELTITTSSSFILEGGIFTIRGQLSPNLSNRNVTIYIANNSPWTAIGTTVTDPHGQFSYSWVPGASGFYQLRVSWSGDNKYATSDSRILPFTVFSTFLIGLIVMAVVFGCFGIAVSLISRRSNQEDLTPQPPVIPS